MQNASAHEVSSEVIISPKTICVIGTGVLGIQISTFLLLLGKKVTIKTRSLQREREIIQTIAKRLEKKRAENDHTDYLGELHVTAEFQDLSDCDLIIEAAIEDLSIKQQIFFEVSSYVREDVPIMTNSSSLSLDRIVERTSRPERCIGFHFFNPVDKMELVEIVIGDRTSNNTIEYAEALAKIMGKKSIRVKNSPGYIVNRLLFLQLNEAMNLVEKGIAKKEDIDTAMKLGLRHPMGPFELADYIGLDICLRILETISNDLDERFRPSPVLVDLVERNKLGRKTGEGFYLYPLKG